MHGHSEAVADVCRTAAAAARSGDDTLLRVLDELSVPIYVTDAQGVITYYNHACIAFAGRTPAVGEDAWCVTWKLHTEDGEFLPHDQCPMAVALREKRAVRNVEAVAERPNGSLVNFVPYPTPLLDDEGNVVGGVNMLVDVTDRRRAAYLHSKVMRCRHLADAATDRETADTLMLIAGYYEGRVLKIPRMH